MQCGGSDEPDGACPSTCAELAAKENVGLQKKLDEVTKALAAKKSGEEGGQQALREWKAELPKLQAELAALVPTFGSLSAAHDALLRTEASQVIRPTGAERLNRRPPVGSCRLFLGPGFRLAAR